MDITAYDALITRLETQSGTNPTSYRLKVRLLASLGYAVAGTLLVLAVILLAAGVLGLWLKPSAATIKIAIFVAVFALPLVWSIVRAVLYRDSPPEGVPVSRSDAPDLWDEVDRLRSTLSAPRIHRILIDNDLNAALVTRRWGVLPFTRQWLVLGLPLLRLLSVDEMRTVIAHELGHARGDHGKFGRWIYTARRLWASLHDALAEGSQGLMARFLRWYAPYFNAYTFVLARQQEREADAAAVEAANSEAAAAALVRVTVAARRGQERFWSALPRRAYREAQPPGDLLGALQRALIEPHPHQGRWLTEALATSSGHHDTHPCLRERLAAITGSTVPSTIPPPIPPSRSAAATWLMQCDSEIVEQLNSRWADAITPVWNRYHEMGKAMFERRDELLARVDELDRQERWEVVHLLDDLDGAPATRPHLEWLVEQDGDDLGARFALGRVLLDDEHDADRGAELLLAVIERDADAIVPAASLLAGWHARHGRVDDAKRWELHAARRAELEAKANEERSRLPKPKQLQAHGLPEAGVERLRQVLAAFPTIRWADVASVACTHLPEKPYHIVAVRIKVPFWKSRDAAVESALLQQVVDQLAWPHAITIISDHGKHAKLAKAIRKQPGARVYKR